MVARYKLHEGIMLGLTRQKKRNKFLCYFSRFFVTLHPHSEQQE